MAKKTYRTYYLKSLNLHLTGEDGERVNIEFRGGIQVDSTAKYTTRDPYIQNMLESVSGFGRDYYIESVKEDEQVAKPVAEKKPVKEAEKTKAEKPVMDTVKDSRRFQNLVEMKNAMAEVGIEVTPDMNYMAAKAAAQKEGYDYQIQK